MAIIKDWVTDAAEEIHMQYDKGHFGEDVLRRTGELIWKHCPFKPDAAYEEVSAEKTDVLKKLAEAVTDLEQIEKDIEAGYRNGVRDDHADEAAGKVIELARSLVKEESRVD